MPSLAHPAAAPIATGPGTSLRGAAMVAFLGVACGVQMSDRGVYALRSADIKAAFQVSDAVIGALHGIAGILVASALAVPLARLADQYSRKRILLAMIAAWTGLTALGALAPNFWLFFLGRAASGVTEFAMIPIVYSLIPDLVAERDRVAANLGFAALMAVGASAGFYFGGDLFALARDANLFGLPAWRATILLLSLAGLPLLALGALLTDPPRGAVAARTDGPGTLAGFVRAEWRAVALFLAAAGGVAIAVQAAGPLAAMALNRRFGADFEQIGHALGVITLAVALASLPVAGIADRLLRGRLAARGRPLIMALAAAAAIPCILLFGSAPDQQSALRLLAGFTLLTCIGNALIPTILQDLVPGDLRARAFAAYSFVIAAFCALGPVLAGAAADHVTGHDLLAAIRLAATPFLVVAAVGAALLMRTEQPRH